MVADSIDESHFRRNLLTNRQVSRIHKAFGNGSAANIKFWKTQLSKIVKLGGILNFLDLYYKVICLWWV